MAAGEFRLRVCYRKTGVLRFLSHLEVMRALERGARRAGMPYAVTKGFNRKMKVAFGPALPVGTAGEREYYDVWLTGYVPAEEALGRLAGAMPAELAPLEARYVDQRDPSLTAAATLARYRVRVEGKGGAAHELHEALDAVVGEGTLTREHKGKTKVYDLTRSLPKGAEVTSDGPDAIVEVAVRMGDHGSLRPEVLLENALDRMDGDGVALTVTRTDVLIETEDGPRRPI